MNIGDLNRRVTVVGVPTSASDGVGGANETATTSKIVFSAVKQISQYESLNYGIEQNQAGYEFLFRYGSVLGITLKHSLVYLGRNFRIVKIQNVNEANDFVKVIAYERAA